MEPPPPPLKLPFKLPTRSKPRTRRRSDAGNLGDRWSESSSESESESSGSSSSLSAAPCPRIKEKLPLLPIRSSIRRPRLGLAAGVHGGGGGTARDVVELQPMPELEPLPPAAVGWPRDGAAGCSGSAMGRDGRGPVEAEAPWRQLWRDTLVRPSSASPSPSPLPSCSQLPRCDVRCASCRRDLRCASGAVDGGAAATAGAAAAAPAGRATDDDEEEWSWEGCGGAAGAAAGGCAVG